MSGNEVISARLRKVDTTHFLSYVEFKEEDMYPEGDY